MSFITILHNKGVWSLSKYENLVQKDQKIVFNLRSFVWSCSHLFKRNISLMCFCEPRYVGSTIQRLVGIKKNVPKIIGQKAVLKISEWPNKRRSSHKSEFTQNPEFSKKKSAGNLKIIWQARLHLGVWELFTSKLKISTCVDRRKLVFSL